MHVQIRRVTANYDDYPRYAQYTIKINTRLGTGAGLSNPNTNNNNNNGI